MSAQVGVALGWLAAALVLLPTGSRTTRRGIDRRRGGVDRTTQTAKTAETAQTAAARARRTTWVAGVAVAVGALALGGLVRGGVAAAVLVPVAVAASRALARRPVSGPPDRSVALPLDLAAAALRSGRPLGDALLRSAPAAGPDAAALMTRVARMLRLGADAPQAWAAIPAGHPLAALAATAVRSATSGIKLADAFERHARELRDEAAAQATARAQRAGVAAMGPLAACFLPSFLCLGVAPTVIGIAGRVFGGLG